jgi:hypothetical protein
VLLYILKGEVSSTFASGKLAESPLRADSQAVRVTKVLQGL